MPGPGRVCRGRLANFTSHGFEHDARRDMPSEYQARLEPVVYRPWTFGFSKLSGLLSSCPGVEVSSPQLGMLAVTQMSRGSLRNGRLSLILGCRKDEFGFGQKRSECDNNSATALFEALQEKCTVCLLTINNSSSSFEPNTHCSAALFTNPNCSRLHVGVVRG